MPRDYARILDALRKAEDEGLSPDEAAAAAFEANVGVGN
jgi:hypothetical protein